MQEVRPLTEKQKQVLDFITKFAQENGFAPSLREVASFVATDNLSTAQYYIEQLTEKGYLKKDSYKSRGIFPVIQKQTVQLLGFIAAGEPLEPLESPTSITLPNDLTLDQRYPHYALKVKGDSMIDMGILSEDIVLIRHQLTANNGDVVVAITEKGATLKVFKKDKDIIRLVARNKEYPDIYPQQLEIRGRFVGLIRKG
jgi:repressor LexA